MKATILAITLALLLPSVSAQTCNTAADTDCDGNVNITEVVNYINIWYSCSACAPDLLDVINAYFDNACVPNCTGRECGDDGCGSECGICGPGEQCNASGICVPGPGGCVNDSDCSYLSLPEVNSCNDPSDANPMTLDHAPENASLCNTTSGNCTVPTQAFTHTCDLACGAQCTGSSCVQDCDGLDACVGSVLHDYHDVASNCTGCLCEARVCDNITVYPSHESCNYVPVTCGFITEPGNYRLAGDSEPDNNATCVAVVSDDVLFDCQGHTIDGAGTANSAGLFLKGSGITVRNCRVINMRNDGEGIYMYDADDALITNCTFNNTDVGVYMNESTDVTVTGNAFFEHTTGVSVRPTSGRARVNDNVFVGGNNLGTAVSSYSAGSEIASNRILGYDNGVTLMSGSRNTSVTRNNISSVAVGIVTYGQGLFIGSNDLWSIRGTALSIGRDGGAPPTIRGNVTVTGNNVSSCAVGIFVEGGASNLVSGNAVWNATVWALVTSQDHGNLFTGNSLTGSGTGLRLEVPNNTMVLGNTISGNSYGIYSYEPSNVTLSGNNICGNVEDLHCERSSNFTVFSGNRCGNTSYICGGYCEHC